MFGTNQGYGHYGTGKLFDEKHCTIDVWPDVSEYPKTYETSFKHADGRKARVFSSADQSTVDLHFKWMKDYGVDGVFMQRFVGYTRGNQENSVPNRILANALEAASKYDRAIAVMYDLSDSKFRQKVGTPNITVQPPYTGSFCRKSIKRSIPIFLIL